MMGMIVADLAAKLGLDDSEFNRGMDGVAGKATRSEKILGGVSKAAMAGAVAAGALVVKSLDTYNNFGTSINTLTRLTGMSSQAASKLTGQWQRFGVDSQSGINATKFLAKNLDMAQQAARKTQGAIVTLAKSTKDEIGKLDPASKTYAADVAKIQESSRDNLKKLEATVVTNKAAFARLGVSIFDAHGKLKSVDTILPQVRDKLSQMDNAGQRTALTLKLFGKGGADMLGWLTKTPKEIAAVNKELQGLGMVWGGKQVKDWKALKDAQREMGLQWTALQLNLAQTLLPALKTLMGYVQTGIKDWNNLSDGAQGFILKALGIAGALGLIAPKALAAGAAIKTMFAASAASGAAGAAGSAGGGLLSGVGANVGANVASAAGIGGASKGYQAMTASKMMGGAGVTPAAAVFEKGSTSIAVSAVKLAGAVGLMVTAAEILGKLYGDKALKPGAQAPPGERGGAGTDKWSGGAGATKAAEEAAAKAAATAEKAAAAIGNAMAKLGAKAATATGPAFDRIREQMTNIQKLTDKGFEFGDIKAKHTDSQMRSIRDRIMSTLHITQKQADAIMASMFKSWHPLPTVMGKISPAMAAAEARINQLRAQAARAIQFGNPNVTGLLNSIGQAESAFNGMSSAARTAGMAAANALSASAGRTGRGWIVHASGGVFSTPHVGLVAEAGPEAIIPLSNPRRAAQVMDEAGLSGRGGGSSFTFGNVSVVLPPGDYGDSEDAGSAAADAFMQRTRELARGY